MESQQMRDDHFRNSKSQSSEFRSHDVGLCLTETRLQSVTYRIADYFGDYIEDYIAFDYHVLDHI